jgi:hypothetical protein
MEKNILVNYFFKQVLEDNFFCIGQWQHGKMNGVGILKCQNGDMIQGNFKNHYYHGVCVLIKANGDSFLGNDNDIVF